MASHDRLGLEAIRNLHRQLDDDANGVIELSESDEVSEDDDQDFRENAESFRTFDSFMWYAYRGIEFRKDQSLLIFQYAQPFSL